MKKYKLLLILPLLFIAYNSCDDSSLDTTNINYITLDDYSKSIVVPENTSVDTELKIFTSSKMSSDTTIDLNITTSMASDNYSIPASVTIPANSNEATISISLTDNSLNRNGETMSISFNALEGYFKGYTEAELNISVLCPSDLAGSWIYTNGNGKTVSISETGDGTYTISGDNAFGSDYPFDISDACGNISITGGYLEDEFGIPVSGSGSVSEDKNTITLIYTVDGYFSDRTMILSKN